MYVDPVSTVDPAKGISGIAADQVKLEQAEEAARAAAGK